MEVPSAPDVGIPLAPPTLSVGLQSALDAKTIVQSLRHDIANHPNDFLTFETKTAASHFIAEHYDAQRETDYRVIERGIMGYWHSKMLVILPSIPAGEHL
jgi:hypothetical protein